ncbi:MAG: ATP-binding cassette domain-containing protein [bacterium]
MSEDIILSVSGLFKHYKYYKTLFDIKKHTIKAVDGVTFNVLKNEIFAVVGETGCGKSTLSKLITGLTEKTSGDIYFKGEPLDYRNKSKNFRKKIQILFQDPYSSLNPKKKIYKIVSYPAVKNGVIKNRHKDRMEFAVEQLKTVGLPENTAYSYPHMLSGGQRQRVGIARCLSVSPELLVLDEPVSALDVSISAQILNLLMDMQEKAEISYIFITHDLKLVRHIADRVCVMYGGKIMEIAKSADFFNEPAHPYSYILKQSMMPLSFDFKNKSGFIDFIDSIGFKNKESRNQGSADKGGEDDTKKNINGNGCVYFNKCYAAQDICITRSPLLKDVGDGRAAACFFPFIRPSL